MHFEAGFRAMKVKLGYGVEDDIAVMRDIRRALGERKVTLMVDTNHAYGRAEALRLGYALEEYDLRWYEEPVAPEDLAGYCELRSKLRIPLAGGENEHTVYGFRDLLAARAVDIAQPDIHLHARDFHGGFSLIVVVFVGRPTRVFNAKTAKKRREEPQREKLGFLSKAHRISREDRPLKRLGGLFLAFLFAVLCVFSLRSLR